MLGGGLRTLTTAHGSGSMSSSEGTAYSRHRLDQPALRDRLRSLTERGAAPAYVAAFRDGGLPASLADGSMPDFRGRSVLDVGCNLGLRCFEAVHHGAARVVGIDANPDRVLQARALADSFGVHAEFLHMDADAALPSGTFDVVCCFDVLHRSIDPVGLLQRLGRQVKETLIIESPGLDHPAAIQSLQAAGVRWWDRRRLRQAPVLLAARNGPNLLWDEARFFLSPHTLRRLLLHHQGRFADVQVHAAARSGRFRALAQRRRLSGLVLIAGASGVGKSTFMTRLREGTLPSDIAEQIGAHEWRGHRMISAFELADWTERPAEGLLFHYDLNRASRYPAKRFVGDAALQIVECAERVACVTLWAAPVTLTTRKSARFQGKRRFPRANHSLRALPAALRRRLRAPSPVDPSRWHEQQELDLAVMSDPALLQALYREWLAFCDTQPFDTHWLVDASSEAYRLLPAARADDIFSGSGG
jgi:SAM-dependent methyltransferase